MILWGNPCGYSGCSFRHTNSMGTGKLGVRDGAAQVTQLQTRYGMTGTVQTQERGGAGGAQPPLNCRYSLQVAKTRMVAQEQFRGNHPPELLAAHDTASDTVCDRDCANARARGCRGGPPELCNSFECRSSLQRPGCHLRNGRTGAVGCRGSAAPPELLSLH